MNRTRLTAGVAVVAALAVMLTEREARAQAPSSAKYASDGKLLLPVGYRKWTFLGAPLTPDGLNNGKAGFPEYHNVYVEDRNLSAYQRDGKFPEGTVIVKELVRLRGGSFPDGSASYASGRGFSPGTFNGMDVMVKDSSRYAATNGWGFFNFGHHALPYEASAKAASEAECAGCHRAGAGKTDMTWVDFYPVLRGKN